MYSQYDVVRDVGDETNFRVIYEDEEEWDIWWIDGAVNPTILMRMQPWQRTNHFPGMHVLARKNCLAKGL